MKKLTALLLALVMLFSLTACSFSFSDDCNGDHIDEDGDLICDVCGDDIDPEDPEDEKDPQKPKDDSYLAPTISEAIAAQLESASSMKIDISLEFDMVQDAYTTEFDDNGSAILVENDSKNKGSFTVSLVVSKTENGFNAKLDATAKQDGNDNEMSGSLYIIDGSFYQFDKDLDAYVETVLPSLDALMSGANTPAAITEMISSMLAQLEIPKEEQDALLAEIGTIITGIFEIVDKKGDFNLDFKPYLDEFFTYIKDIDVETKTIESLVNDALHLADPELDVADIIAELKRIAKLSLETALAELDQWLVENTEDKLDLQGIYDTIVADERVEQLVRTYMGMLGVPEGEDPIDEEDIQAFLAELRAVKVKDFIKQYYPDLSAITVYDALMTILSALGPKDEAPAPLPDDPNYGGSVDSALVTMESEDEEPYPPVNTLFGAIEDMLAMTLSEAETEFGMASVIARLKSAVAGITVNALSTSSNIAFTESFSLESLAIGAKVDIATEFPNNFDATKTDKHSEKIDFNLSISSISDKTVEIKLPEDAKTVFGFFNIEEIFSSEDGMYELELYWPYEDEDGKFIVEGELYVTDMCFDISMEMPTEKQEIYVFDYTCYPINTVVTGKLTIVFDYDNYTYRVIAGAGE